MSTRGMTTTERFWHYVIKQDGCWIWLGGIDKDGYSRLTVDRGNMRGHRFSYELHKGPIPEGLVIDHLCRNRLCVNPDHLEAVSDDENRRRGNSPYTINARKTHCPHGHAYDAANTRCTRRGHRLCRECGRAHKRRYRAHAAALRARADSLSTDGGEG